MKFSDIPLLTRDGEWECHYDLKSAVRQIEEWESEEGLQLNPDFQRGHVWVEAQQIKYIEYILQGGKTAKVIYFNNPGWRSGRIDRNNFVCVDGLQRITAIKRFINNEIKVFGYYYKEFEGNIRSMEGIKFNVNTLKTRKEVLQWYIEYNSYGTIHTEEEINRVKELLSKEE